MRQKTLRIARGLDLPLDAVTRRIAWMGATGSGKTFGCKRMVEQMLRAGAQVVILDGMGVWPGLRLGKKPFKIPVFGGLYGDIPLEPTGGALVADVIVDRRTSIVLDVSQMLDAERTRFATGFAQRFFQRKKAVPSAVHLVLEECQDFVPENYMGGEERMLHEFVRISKQGRTFGIGVSFISQRPQEVSKKALNQAECIFAFSMNGRHERKALEAWLTDKGLDTKLADILPTLEIGAPHVWSPQWLKVSKVVRILPIESLDTSATPEVGSKALAQKKLRPIDLKALTAAMVETIERSKTEDPKLLRARIAELEKTLAKKQPRTAAPKPNRHLEQYEIVVDGRNLKEALEVTEELEKRLGLFGKHIEDLRRTVNGSDRALRHAMRTGTQAPAKRLAKASLPAKQDQSAAAMAMHRQLFDSAPQNPRRAHPQTAGATRAAGSLPKGERAVLTAVAQHGDEGVTRAQLTALTGYKRSSRDAYASRLSSAGFVELQGNRIIATPAGVKELGDDYAMLPTGIALLEHWLKELPEGERRILEFVAASQPHAISRAQIEEFTGYKRSSRDAYISRLSSRQLVRTDRNGVRLAESLIG